MESCASMKSTSAIGEDELARGEQEPADNEYSCVGLLDLSDDVLLCVLQYCNPRDLKALGFSCARLGRLVCDRSLWCRVDARAHPISPRQLDWYLEHVLGPSTRSLALKGFAEQAKGCLGMVEITRPIFYKSTVEEPAGGEADGAGAAGGEGGARSRVEHLHADVYGELPEPPPPPPPPGAGVPCPRPCFHVRRRMHHRQLPRFSCGPAWRAEGDGEAAAGGGSLPDGACGGPRWSLALASLPRLRDTCAGLAELRLEHCNIDCNVTQICYFPSTLKLLSFRGSRCFNMEVDKTYLFRIQDYIPQLEELDVSECGWLEPATLLPLSKIKELRVLRAERCRRLTECVAYASLAARYGFRKLQVLDVRGTPLGDSEVAGFGWLPELRELYLEAADTSECQEEHSHYLDDPRGTSPDLEPWEEEEPDYFRSEVKVSDTEKCSHCEASPEGPGSCSLANVVTPKPGASTTEVDAAQASEEKCSCVISPEGPGSGSLANVVTPEPGASTNEVDAAQASEKKCSRVIFPEGKGSCSLANKITPEPGVSTTEVDAAQVSEEKCSQVKVAPEGPGSCSLSNEVTPKPGVSTAQADSAQATEEKCSREVSPDGPGSSSLSNGVMPKPGVSPNKAEASEEKCSEASPKGQGSCSLPNEVMPNPGVHRSPVFLNWYDEIRRENHALERDILRRHAERTLRDFQGRPGSSSDDSKEPPAKRVRISESDDSDSPDSSNTEGTPEKTLAVGGSAPSTRSNANAAGDIGASVSRRTAPNIPTGDRPSTSTCFKRKLNATDSPDDGPSFSTRPRPSPNAPTKPDEDRPRPPATPPARPDDLPANNHGDPGPEYADLPNVVPRFRANLVRRIERLVDRERENENEQNEIDEIDDYLRQGRVHVIYVNVRRPRHDVLRMLVQEQAPRAAEVERAEPAGRAEQEPPPPRAADEEADRADERPDARHGHNFAMMQEFNRLGLNNRGQVMHILRMPFVQNFIYGPAAAHAHIGGSSLVTDAAINRLGNSVGCNVVNYVHIGPVGALRAGAPPATDSERLDKSKLRVLVCRGFCGITTRSMNHLVTAAPELRLLDVTGTKVTERDVATFKNLRPECEVKYTVGK